MKKLIATITLIISMSICMAGNTFAVQSDITSGTNASTLPVREEDVMNEYDYIVDIRSKDESDCTMAKVSSEEIEYIKSNAVEEELLYRASLPAEKLRDYYCYSNEAIQILKEYDGRRLEDAPEMRSVLATFSAGLGELVKTPTRTGVIYTWSWSSKPVVCHNDCVAVAWEGTYRGGLHNNMAFDFQRSFLHVNYYGLDGQVSYKNFTSDNSYNGGGAYFPMLFKADTWAKSGAFYAYMNLVNQVDGPKLIDLSVHAEYAHAGAIANLGVSFPRAATISFSGNKTVHGVKNIRLTAIK